MCGENIFNRNIMNIKRAILFGIILYLVSFLIIGSLRILFGGYVSDTYALPLRVFVVAWIVYIPVLFFLTKWYFREVSPSVKHGFWLGIIAYLTTSFIDLVGFTSLRLAGQPTEIYGYLYGDWKFWVTLAWGLVLCMLSGGEFDKTFTKRKS